VALGKKKLALRRQWFRWRASRPLLHADPLGYAQRPGAWGLPARGHCPHRRAPGEPPAPPAALEHRSPGDAQRRRL